jgi:hypothetical protein
MSSITTRAAKGSALTHAEVDANFTNLNSGKAEVSGQTFTGPVVLPAGSATAGGVQVGTGATYKPSIYSPGADQVAISTGGSGRLFVDASGNIVINGSASSGGFAFSQIVPVSGSPVNSFRVTNGSDATYDVKLQSGLATIGAGVGSLAFITNDVERIRLDTSGRVGIGVSVPQDKLHVAGGDIVLETADPGTRLIRPTVAGGAIQIASSSATTARGLRFGFVNNALAFSEFGRFDESGRLGIGTTSPLSRLHVEDTGEPVIYIRRDTTSAVSLGGPIWRNNSFNVASIIAQNINSNSADLTFSTSSGGSLSERARIDSSGRLLVGTSTAVGTDGIQLKGPAGGNAGLKLLGGNTGSLSANSTIAQINFSDGYWGGTGASINAVADATQGDGDYPTRLEFSTTSDGAANPTERFRINSTGTHFAYGLNDVFYSITNRSAGTTYATFIGLYGGTSPSSAGTISFIVYSNGNVGNTNNSYGAYSDIKLKENIIDAGSQWNDLKALQVRKYNFKEGQTHTQIGLVAQEAELVSPGLVYETPDRDAEGNDLGTVTKSLNYSVLYMKAVKALQEAIERIEALEAKVTALETA